MKTQDEPDGNFVVQHDSTRGVRWIMWGAIVALAFCGGFAWATKRLEGISPWMVGAASLAAIALVAAESGLFVFDKKSRVVRWKRSFVGRQREGTLPFDEVEAVTLERPIGDTGVPCRRITLRLQNGKMLPLRSNYKTDRDDELLKIAGQIRDALGLPPTPPPADAIKALVAQGKTIEAIKELRRTRGLSLVEAKREVDAIDAGRS
jgi:hypothetical protein